MCLCIFLCAYLCALLYAWAYVSSGIAVWEEICLWMMREIEINIKCLLWFLSTMYNEWDKIHHWTWCSPTGYTLWPGDCSVLSVSISTLGLELHFFHPWLSHMSTGDPNSGPHACLARQVISPGPTLKSIWFVYTSEWSCFREVTALIRQSLIVQSCEEDQTLVILLYQPTQKLRDLRHCD